MIKEEWLTIVLPASSVTSVHVFISILCFTTYFWTCHFLVLLLRPWVIIPPHLRVFLKLIFLGDKVHTFFFRKAKRHWLKDTLKLYRQILVIWLYVTCHPFFLPTMTVGKMWIRNNWLYGLLVPKTIVQPRLSICGKGVVYVLTWNCPCCLSVRVFGISRVWG